MWNKNERDGTIKQVTGKATQAVARATGDQALEAEGRRTEAAGTVEKSIGRARRKIGKAVVAAGKAIALAGCVAAASSGTLSAQSSKEHDRITNSGMVMEEVLGIPENIPEEILNNAKCVVVVPSVTTLAMGVGGSYGRGVMICRSGAALDGPWGTPAMYALEAGSIGFQLGAESTDLVLMVMNVRGVTALLDGAVKLGAQASVAAGPKGRHVEAATDVTMRAEILSYSRSRGLFAGISIEGTSLRPDNDANTAVFGTPISARAIMAPGGPAAPASAVRLITALQKASPRHTQKKSAGRSER